MENKPWNPAEFVWNNKTHSSMAEAFKDNTYAEPLWKCETDLSRTTQYVVNMFGCISASLLIGFLIGIYIR